MSIVTMFSMVACGPAKEHDEEAEKQRIEDSIRVADSTAAAQQAMEEEMAAQQDTSAVDTSASMEEAPMEAPMEEGHGDH
ncbi:MAG: hypothetical protein GC180_03595 [Bacteroidetes bacterium]|nr:hypothetical protein [Bacteroidota bacterium]